MFYYSDNQLDQWLLDDINLGDLTTRTLGIEKESGRMTYMFRQDAKASGIAVSMRLLRKLNLEAQQFCEDGDNVPAGKEFIVAQGNAAGLHMAWKVTQNIVEWTSGVATYTHDMLTAGQSVNPKLRIACTRKSIPGTKVLANAAVLHGGGIIHRGGTAESILLFANHRCFTNSPEDFKAHLDKLKIEAPEKKIIIEADNSEEARQAIKAGSDIVQLDKFPLEEIAELARFASLEYPECTLLVAGGVNKDNIVKYARTGVQLIVSSAPYYAKPLDVKVVMKKE